VSLQGDVFSIMKSYKNYPFASVCYTLLLSYFAILPLEARIGDSQQEFERRLATADGIAYRDEAIIAARRKGMVYEEYLSYLISNYELKIYYKPAENDRKALRSQFDVKRKLPGWEVHVLYINGKSAMELYQRSQPMSDQERNLLLLLQGDGKQWMKNGNERLDSNSSNKEEASQSAFNFQMVRSDGQVRAAVARGGLLFVDAQRDTQLAQVREEALDTSAPESVSGF